VKRNWLKWEDAIYKGLWRKKFKGVRPVFEVGTIGWHWDGSKINFFN